MRIPSVAATVIAASVTLCSAQKLRSDPVKKGPELEIEHLYNGQWPTGIAVSKTGRRFSCFPAGLDPANVNNGLNNKFQVAELIGKNTEKPYPNERLNNPPGGAINLLHVPPVTRGLSQYFLGVQNIVIDELDTLWILDTGRVIDITNLASPLLNSTVGGPKLVAVDLKTDKVINTIAFPRNVALPQSYFNDVRMDRKRGFAYITDSSPEGFNALVTVDLKTQQSWRVKRGKGSAVLPIPKTLPWVYGEPMYQILSPLKQALNPGYITFGADGISLDPTRDTLYFSVIAGRFLYSVPTAILRKKGVDMDPHVKNLGEKGISDGLETDSNGIVYGGNMEQDAVFMYDPKRGLATNFVRDPRINWVDTMMIANGFLYFTCNQLNDLQAIYPGMGAPLMDRREPPYALFRVPLPNNGTKIM